MLLQVTEEPAFQGLGMFSYTNRKGVTYHLHAVQTKRGKVRYVLTQSPQGALAELPSGYEVSENVNGQVSVRRVRPRRITVAEEELVRKALESHGLDEYRVEAKGRYITVFEPDRDPEEMAACFAPFALPGNLGQQLESKLRQERRLISRLRSSLKFEAVGQMDIVVFYKESLDLAVPPEAAAKLARHAQGDFRGVVKDALMVEKIMKTSAEKTITEAIVEKACKA